MFGLKRLFTHSSRIFMSFKEELNVTLKTSPVRGELKMCFMCFVNGRSERTDLYS